MNRYFLVLDSKNRLVCKKKLKPSDHPDNLVQEYKKLDYQTYLIEGSTFSAALLERDLILSKESAFYLKRDLKEKFYFTDKRIKEFLGDPDQVEKVKGSSDKVMHLYSKTRVEAIVEDPKFKAYADRVKSGREERIEQRFEIKKRPEIERSEFRTSWKEGLARDKLKQLVRKLRKDWDLNEYKDFFPAAREMNRKHIFLVGPTNSGKSYRGFNELATGSSGVYLAPLRLLALEGQEEVEKRGKECSLLTGEEMELKEGASFVASTIEMANLEKPIDCALVDEVQLILDRNRGWAWTQAIVGIPAQRIIMTGSEECIPTLKRLIEDYLGEELEIIKLDRIGKLDVLKKPVGNLKSLEPGTAMIAFSRRGVLALKKELEDVGKRVSVLYGNLSPGVRREEAKRFRSGETEILVATDCIGMGLNLPIKTVIFSETTKFDGKEMRELTIQEVKQIAGRAGRYGKFECGYVGVVNPRSLTLVSENVRVQALPVLDSCFVRPTQTQLEVLCDQLGGQNIKNAISLFSQLSQANSTIACSDLSEMISLAERIEMIGPLSELPFKDKYLFTCAPVSVTDAVIHEYLDWLVSYSKKIPVDLSEGKYRNYINQGSTTEDRILNDAEICVKVLTLYHWLARKRSEFFPGLEKCEELREQINTFIENSLKRRGLHRKCPQCQKKLSLHHSFKVCNDCYRSGRGQYQSMGNRQNPRG
jgi:ATP-dependent RNA helicase SUPV3L1/SUV3